MPSETPASETVAERLARTRRRLEREVEELLDVAVRRRKEADEADRVARRCERRAESLQHDLAALDMAIESVPAPPRVVLP